MSSITLYLICLLLNSFWLQQDQEATKPNRVETELVQVTGEYKYRDQRNKIISGTAFFLVEEMQSDLSIKGRLFITLRQQSLQTMAETVGASDTKLEEKVEYSAFAFLKRNTKCPKPILSLQNVRIPYFHGEILVSNLSLPLSLKNSSKKLSDVFCLWIESSNAGRAHTYKIGNSINELIKDKK